MTDQPTAREEALPAESETAGGRPTELPENVAEPRALPPEPSHERVDAPPETGDPRVGAALAGLADIAGRPPAEHVAVYEEVHRRLQETLADLDDDG